MNERRRDIVVGIFVLLGLVVLGVLIVQFRGAVSYFTGRQNYYLEIEADQTAAVLPGQAVHLNGYPIGEISKVRLADDPRQGVIITASINQAYSIPEDVKTVSIYQGQIGPPFIQIMVLPTNSAKMMDKTPGEVVARLKAKIPADPFSQISEMAEELRPTLKELGPALARIAALAENLNRLLVGAEPNEAEPSEKPGTDQVNLRSLAQQFSQTLNNLNAVIGDEQNRENLKQSLANLSQAGADASEALKELKAFAGQAKNSTSELSINLRDAAQAVINNSEQISILLQHLNKTVEQINQGQGTAGKILYDPQLYEEMLSATENLNEAVQTLHNLLKKWNSEGIKLKW